ncbi:hypothetical protein FRC09_014913 [Ceratobasidium sp. 395]|nr:hypothetical protein FRC09_014913 [Ceratobasidium sp. 395]
MSNWLASSQPPTHPKNQHRIVFPKILNESWYNKRRYLKVNTIQYRKEFHAPFRHEYLILFLSDGSICRFDRRPDPSVPLDALKERGSEAYDTVEEITTSTLEGPSIQATSECLATLTFRNELDFFFVFLVCYGIQSDPQAVRYTLLQYNCYFFSWTIILNIARNSVTWEGLPSSSSFKELPKNVASELSEMLVHKLLAQSTTLCNDLMHKVLAQLAVLIPSRLSIRLPHLRKSLQQLPDLLRGAADTYSPVGMVRWRFLRSKMFYSLEYALTNEIFRRKLLRCMRKQIQWSGQLGYPLCNVLNNVLRRTLWRHSMNKVIRRATAKFLSTDDDEDGVPSIHVRMWNVVAEIISHEVILTFRENVLSLFAGLVCGVVASCAKQPKVAESSETESMADRVYKVVEDTIDACMSDILEESLADAVWGSVQKKKEINGAIARAMGSVIADLLQDSQLPFALKVRNPWSIRDPLLLKSEIRWHIARWAKKTTAGVDLQVSHSMLEQYFEYRIAAHSRGVRRFDAVAGHTVDTGKELHKAMHRVWEVVSGVPRAHRQDYSGY